MKFDSIFHDIKYFVRKYKYTLIAAVFIIFSVFIISKIVKKTANKHHAINQWDIIDCDRSLYATAPIESVRVLNDNNDIQNIHAQANGLKNIYISNAAFEEDSAMLVGRHVLVHLTNNQFYHIKELTHSYPFTTPEMADLLNTIGSIFYRKLKEKKYDVYRPLITSALRTNETQESLTRRNRNASTQSAHLYGATIDITYKEFYNVKTASFEPSWQAAEVLRETMLDLREQCRLLVVRERRQACYHFTVVNCDPTKHAAKEHEINK